MSFKFKPEKRPFPRWLGPFSPARGNRSGFRFHQDRLGTWVSNEFGTAFWPVADGDGVKALGTLVKENWGGGRILLLPNGFVIKPLQADNEVGKRQLVGRFQGPVILETPENSAIDLSVPGKLRPGTVWPGPATTGLECAIQSDGSLVCSWYHPTEFGRDQVTEVLRKPDRQLSAGFRAARPGTMGGRVRITANGNIITNRQERNREWVSIYVGWIDPGSLNGWDKWIERDQT